MVLSDYSYIFVFVFISTDCLFLCVDRYVLVPTGAGPGVSVGHTCTFLPSKDGGKGRIVLVGGANPNGSFSESYIINLGTSV